MNWVLGLLFFVALVEIVMRLPFQAHLKSLIRSSNRAVHVARAKAISDHWKEKVMGTYAWKTFAASVTIAGYLTVVLGAAALLVLILNRFSDGFGEFIISWAGLTYGILAASVYLVVRKAFVHD